MPKPTVILAVIASLALSAGVAVADEADAGSQAADRSGSQTGPGDPGPISGQGEIFQQLDSNEDGELDAGELNDYGVTETSAGAPTGDPDRGDRLLELFDRDKDGVVTEDEFDQGPRNPPEGTRPNLNRENVDEH